MRRLPRFHSLLLLVGLLVSETHVDAQEPLPGTVRSESKISQDLGDFLPLDPGDQFGRSVACVGDIDLDGIPDLVVGAQNDDDGGTNLDSNLGAIWVLFLRSDGTVRAREKISATRGGFTGTLDLRDQFGRAVGALGDLDGDGVPDVAVGSSRDDDGGNNHGAVWILFLNTDGSVKNWSKISSTQGGFTGQLDNFDEFGRSVVAIGDLDDDGVPEIAVGAVGDGDGGFMRGAVWILFLNADGTVKAHSKLSDTAGDFGGILSNNDSFGMSIAPVGDLDGDGTVDIVVGAPKDNDGGVRKGSIWTVFLNPDGTAKAEQKVSDVFGNFRGYLGNADEFGTAVCPLDDLNGDGIMDLAVGAILDNGDGESKGAVWVLFLDTDGTVKTPQRINALEGDLVGPLDDEDWFGSALTLMPDLDGDLVRDLAVGARFDDDGDADSGAVWLLRLNGDPNVPPLADFGHAPVIGAAPLTVDFLNTTTGTATSWSWDFGDGSTSTDEAVTHTYTAPGTYTANLVARGPGGSTRAQPRSVEVLSGTTEVNLQASPTNGPWPLDVAFGDLTTGAVTAWSWDFGDGSGSTVQHPIHTYSGSGTFTVSLTVFGPLGSERSVFSDLIQVSEARPDPGFGALPERGPAPLSVAFDDRSTGDVTSWSWDFGDGQGSSEQHPSHTYETAGTYTVQLTITGAGGSARLAQTDLVTVDPGPPGADFGASPTSGVTPLTVLFSNLSMGEVTSWSWEFGDGATSNESDPVHTYTMAGTYSVALTVSGPHGSGRTERTDLVRCQAPHPAADFTASPTAGDHPLAVDFRDASTGSITAWSWDFGDGSSSNEENPTHTYASTGQFDVRLVVQGPGGSAALLRPGWIQVSEPRPIAVIGAEPTRGFAPLTVGFLDLSSGDITSRTWAFGDGNGSGEANPSHVFTAPGTYSVSLQIQGPGGSDSASEAALIRVLDPVPAADFATEGGSGLAPLEVAFQDTSSGEITSWSWDLGDGTTSRDQHPTHTYSEPGDYTVALLVQGPSGSDRQQREGFVRALHPPPAVDFLASPATGFVPLEVSFADQSSGTVTSWAWELGDGSTQDSASFSHTYPTPGSYTITLLAVGPGGSDRLTRVAHVQAIDPVPAADFAMDVSEGFPPLAVTFEDRSIGDVTSWSWSFGDGGTSSASDPQYSFTQPGTYDVTLVARGPAGSDREVRSAGIRVLDPKPIADFGIAPESGPAPLAVSFEDRSQGLITAWTWELGDGTTALVSGPAHTYAVPGDYSVRLTVRGPHGSDRLEKADSVRVSEAPPAAAFVVDPASGFAPLTVDFRDASTGTIESWQWDFGDGATSTEANPSHSYAQPGSYSITLLVAGPGGSSRLVETSAVQVVDPVPIAAFEADPWQGFAPLEVTFTDRSAGAVSGWSWSFGDETHSAISNPTHVYTEPGSYTVSLTVSGPEGSSDATATQPIQVLVLPEPGLLDAGFESQTLGGQPSTPWSVTGGLAHVIRGPGDVEEGFPAEGTQWCELSAEGSRDASPPTNPGGISEPPLGGMGISQTFVLPNGRSVLRFEAAFLNGGDQRSETFNDWMSVDVTDGEQWLNLYYRDSFSTFSATSALHGLASTGLEPVAVDLLRHFPSATESTVFTLVAQVGNGGDDMLPSRGYLDDFRLVEGASVAYYGSGINPNDSLTVNGLPNLGDTLEFVLDNPVGTQSSGATTLLWFSLEPDVHYPAGTLLPRFGMAGPGASGELLISLTPPDPVAFAFGPAWESSEQPARIQVSVPDEISLIGSSAFAQGLLWDASAQLGVKFGLTQAVELRIGP